MLSASSGYEIVLSLYDVVQWLPLGNATTRLIDVIQRLSWSEL